MIIGTVRPEEARIFDSHEGYHQFHCEVQVQVQAQASAPISEYPYVYGSFEIYFNDGSAGAASGWYWQSCFPGCLPDGEAVGPFASSRQAHQDADEWSPEYDDEYEED